MPVPTKTVSLPSPPARGATDGVESTGAPPVLAGQPGTVRPLASERAYTYPALSPTTTAGTPSRVATFGDDKATGRPASGRVRVQTFTNSKPWPAAGAGATRPAPAREVAAKLTAAITAPAALRARHRPSTRRARRARSRIPLSVGAPQVALVGQGSGRRQSGRKRGSATRRSCRWAKRPAVSV